MQRNFDVFLIYGIVRNMYYLQIITVLFHMLHVSFIQFEEKQKNAIGKVVARRNASYVETVTFLRQNEKL